MKQVMNYHKDNGLLNMIRRTDPMIPRRCSTRCAPSATSATAARMPLTSGCARPTACRPGSSSKLCSTVPMSSAPPVSALVPLARATSASPPSAVTRRQKKLYNVSRLGASNSRPSLLLYREHSSKIECSFF